VSFLVLPDPTALPDYGGDEDGRLFTLEQRARLDAIGMAIAGGVRGGLVVSTALGFICALIGPWVAAQLKLSEPFTVNISGHLFPVLCSIVRPGSANRSARSNRRCATGGRDAGRAPGDREIPRVHARVFAVEHLGTKEVPARESGIHASAPAREEITVQLCVLEQTRPAPD
jgi:hypothetical protein